MLSLAPKILSLMLTRKCNLHCNHCYVDAINSDSIITDIPKNLEKNEFELSSEPLNSSELSELKYSSWCEIIDESRSLGYNMLHLFGGEPFIVADLASICEYAISKGFLVLLSTNGVSFHDSDLQWLHKFRTNLRISFTINEISSGWNQIDVKKRNWLKKLTENEVQITISTCLQKSNYISYLSFLREAKTHGPWDFFGIYFSPIGRAIHQYNEMIPALDWLSLLRQVHNDSDLSSRVTIEQSIIMGSTLENPSIFLPFEFKHMSSTPNLLSGNCPWASGNFTLITSTGEIFPCFLTLHQKQYCVGKWSHRGDLKSAYQQIIQGPLNTDVYFGCPAYQNDLGHDVRIKILPISKEPLCLLCPLYSIML